MPASAGNGLQARIKHPRVRRIVLQIHLWSALICGAWIILISVTGSAVVLRREFGEWFAPPNFVEVSESRLSDAQLTEIIRSDWPTHQIVAIGPASSERVPVPVHLIRNGAPSERRYDPYTGVDLGEPWPVQLQVMAWLVDLHDNLLSGATGRRVNGIGGHGESAWQTRWQS